MGTGFILDSQTWKAHRHWATALGSTDAELHAANEDAIEFIAGLRDAGLANAQPIVLNGVIGPCGDAHSPEKPIAVAAAQDFRATQMTWRANTEIDMVTALTFTQADEATGIVRAAENANLPIVASLTVETDGRLPTGQPLGQATEAVDAATGQYAAYFMINCAHPGHFAHVRDDAGWARRIRGLRCNASRKSHAELDGSETLDDGNPAEPADQYKHITTRMPWLNVFGGCCGSDLRHVREIARALDD